MSKVLIAALALLLIVGGTYFYFNLQKSQEPVTNWKTYTNATYGFAFRYPENFNLRLGPNVSYFNGKPWLGISLLQTKTVIINFDMNNPGFGLEGMEVVSRSTTTVNGVPMIRVVSLDIRKGPTDPKIIMYTFEHNGNYFDWFLNAPANDNLSETSFQKIVESFRFL